MSNPPACHPENMRVPLFEDNPIDLEKITSTLRLAGLCVLTASNLPDALSLIELHKTESIPCHFLLIDANLHKHPVKRNGSCGKTIHQATDGLASKGAKRINISQSAPEELGLIFDADTAKSPEKIIKAIMELSVRFAVDD